MVGTLDERRRERARIVGLFVFFLLVIAAFWIQKPIRTSHFLTTVGPRGLPWVKLGTAALMLPVVLLYSSLAARFRREHIVYFCVVTFSLGSLFFWWKFTFGSGTWMQYVYFFYVDIFNSVMVALFWSFANDVTSPEQARRDYGFIGAGGIIGGALGSGLTGFGAQNLGPANLLLVCVALLLGIAGAARWVAHHSDAAVATVARPESALKDAVNGARLTFRSSYLTSIALIVILYEIVSNIIDYQFNTFVALRFTDEAAMAAFLGRFSTAAIVVSAIVQFVVTTAVLRRWGPRVGLLILPVCLALGSASFLVMPLFAVIATAFFSDAALSYSLNQAAKEVLYTPTDEATKYQAKAFIDMFLMRFAKGLSSLLILASTTWLLADSVQALAVISLLVVIAWLACAVAAGRHFDESTTLSNQTPTSPALSIDLQPIASQPAFRTRILMQRVYDPRKGDPPSVGVFARSPRRMGE